MAERPEQRYGVRITHQPPNTASVGGGVKLPFAIVNLSIYDRRDPGGHVKDPNDPEKWIWISGPGGHVKDPNDPEKWIWISGPGGHVKDPNNPKKWIWKPGPGEWIEDPNDPKKLIWKPDY
jgi:hypothetical protein